MALTKVERELFEEKFGRLEDKLDTILDQVKKTNGRVTTLEDKESKHIISCPVNKRVEVLEKRAQRAYYFEKYPLATVVVGFMFAAITIISFLASINLI